MTTLKFALQNFASSDRGRRARALLAPYGIEPEKLLVAVFNQVSEDLPALVPGFPYSTEQLCGPDLWFRLKSDGPRRSAGMCLSHLVAVRAVPLELAKPTGSYPLRFRLVVGA